MKKFRLNLNKDIVIFSVLAVVLIVELAILLPLAIGNLTKLNKNIIGLKQKITATKKEWPRKDEYLDKNSRLKMELDQMRSKAIFPQQETDLFSFLSTASKKFSIEIEVLTPSEIVEGDSTGPQKFKYLPISLSAKSRFHSLAQFLNYLQSGEYFFEIKEMAVSPGRPYHSIEMLIYGLVQEKE